MCHAAGMEMWDLQDFFEEKLLKSSKWSASSASLSVSSDDGTPPANLGNMDTKELEEALQNEKVSVRFNVPMPDNNLTLFSRKKVSPCGRSSTN